MTGERCPKCQGPAKRIGVHVDVKTKTRTVAYRSLCKDLIDAAQKNLVEQIGIAREESADPKDKSTIARLTTALSTEKAKVMRLTVKIGEQQNYIIELGNRDSKKQGEITDKITIIHDKYTALLAAARASMELDKAVQDLDGEER